MRLLLALLSNGFLVAGMWVAFQAHTMRMICAARGGMDALSGPGCGTQRAIGAAILILGGCIGLIFLEKSDKAGPM